MGTRESWTEEVERWRRSGKTSAAYAAEVGVKSGTLLHWSSKLQREKPTTEFLEAMPLKSQGQIEIECGDFVVRVPQDFDSESLANILSTVRRA